MDNVHNTAGLVDPPDDALWERFMAGECNSAEQARVEAWLQTVPGSTSLADEWRAAARTPRALPASFDLEAVQARFWARVRAAGDEHQSEPRRIAGNMWRRSTWWIAAASVAVLLILAGLPFMAHRGTQVGASGRGAVITYVTAKGERANIVLPDGTHITLNVASRIDVPRHFGERDRVVQLHGEAYFDVAHTTGAPFVVDAQGTKTTVLGTAFGVRAYPSSQVAVAVRSGKVAVNNVVLTARDIAQLSPSGTVAVARDQSVDDALAFTTGHLVVANQALRDAVVDLDRWYDVDIRLGDASLNDVRFDGVLVSGSIGDLMEILGKALSVRIVRDGRTLTLYPR